MVVIDTSVAFKWFSAAEDDSKTALKLLADHIKNKNPILIPNLFFYEITNAWTTKKGFKVEYINENLNLLEKYMLTSVQLNFASLKIAASISKQYNVSVYDASYAVLARENGCDLITADEKFAKQVNLPFVKTLASVS